MTTEVESPTGAKFIVWTRDSGIHWDISIELPADVEFDPKNADHVAYHCQLFHSDAEEKALATNATVVDCIKEGKPLAAPDQELVDNEGRKKVLEDCLAAVLEG